MIKYFLKKNIEITFRLIYDLDGFNRKRFDRNAFNRKGVDEYGYNSNEELACEEKHNKQQQKILIFINMLLYG